MSFKRSCLISLLALSLTLCACAGKRSVQRERAFDLLVLHTNDTHGSIAGVRGKKTSADEESASGGYSRFSAYIKRAKAACGKNVLALDAGDQFQGTLFYLIDGWPMLAKLNSLMPYDAMTLGDHEFDEGAEELARFLAKSSIPVVAANIDTTSKGPLSKTVISPFIIRDFQGVKVGIVGLACDSPQGDDVAFLDAKLALENSIKALEAKGVTRIIALTHLGFKRDVELAKSVEGVDLIVGGHSHTYLGPDSKDGAYPTVVQSPSGKPVLVVTAKRSSQYIGDLLVSFDRQGVLSYWKGSLRELPSSSPRDPLVSALIANYTKSIKSFSTSNLSVNSLDGIPDGQEMCRQGDCLTGMLMADAMLEYGRSFGAVAALFPSEEIFEGIPNGSISGSDLLAAVYSRGKIVLRSCMGKDILKVLEQGVAEDGGQGGRLLQVAGLSYVVSPKRPVGKRISKVLVNNGKGIFVPLHPSKTYVVAIEESMVSSGFAKNLESCPQVQSSSPSCIKVLLSYIQAHNPIMAPKSPRIIYSSGK